MFAYVGTRTSRERQARGEGLSVFAVSADQRRLELIQVLGDLLNPSYLLMNRAGDRLYTVHGDGHQVSTLSVDRDSGKISLMQQQDCEGTNPVHLALDPSEQFLVISNHWSSTLAVLPVLQDGTLARVNQLETLQGELGPHRIEQQFAKPHFNAFDPSGNFVVVPDKGLNRIFSFRFKDGKLHPCEPASVVTRETAGPRHIAFHPALDAAYVINELDSTVGTYRFDPKQGTLTALQVLSALPDTYTGDSRASAILVHPNGRWLFCSNRGHDSVTVMRIDPRTGHLKFVRAQSSLGQTPRFMTLSPNAQVLWVLNETHDTMVPFDVKVDDPADPLSAAGAPVHCASPVCMVFGDN